MTENEAIKQLEFDQSMILFDPTTGEEITLEVLKVINKDNYLTYIADGMAIEALKEAQQYREIGTVEECREAVEKQNPVKPIDYDEDLGYFKCPSCGLTIMVDVFSDHAFCLNCGRKLDWDENLEGMEDV